MPTPFDYDPETFAQLQQLLSRAGEGFSNLIPKAYPPPEGTEDPFSQFHTIRKILSGDFSVLGTPPPYPPGQAPSRANEPGGEGFGLAGVTEQEPADGWRPIPGDPTGKFRDPGTGTRFKGGPLYTSPRPAGVPEWQPPPGRYGGAASYLNDLDRASDTRLNLFKRFSAMDPTEARTRMYQKLGIDKPYWSTDELFKQIVELPSLEIDAKMAETQKILGAITDKEQQRRENMWLLQQYLGLGAGTPPDGGVSEKTLKTGTTLAHERRAQEGAERADRRLEGMERREARARPSELAIDGRAADILAREKGYAVKKLEGFHFVYKNANARTPIADSAKVWADARQRAETELRSGAR